MLNITAASVCSLACYIIGIQLRKLQSFYLSQFTCRVHTLCKAINTQRYDKNVTIITRKHACVRQFLSG